MKTKQKGSGSLSNFIFNRTKCKATYVDIYSLSCINVNAERDVNLQKL